MPIANAPATVTKPAAGVIPTKPATAPDAPPNTEALPRTNFSIANQVNAPAAAATCVTSNALPANAFAANALPPLKPNQPTQIKPVPIKVKAKFEGAIGSRL